MGAFYSGSGVIIEGPLSCVLILSPCFHDASVIPYMPKLGPASSSAAAGVVPVGGGGGAGAGAGAGPAAAAAAAADPGISQGSDQCPLA